MLAGRLMGVMLRLAPQAAGGGFAPIMATALGYAGTSGIICICADHALGLLAGADDKGAG